jgi:hypothetical protein
MNQTPLAEMLSSKEIFELTMYVAQVAKIAQILCVALFKADNIDIDYSDDPTLDNETKECIKRHRNPDAYKYDCSFLEREKQKTKAIKKILSRFDNTTIIEILANTIKNIHEKKQGLEIGLTYFANTYCSIFTSEDDQYIPSEITDIIHSFVITEEYATLEDIHTDYVYFFE